MTESFTHISESKVTSAYDDVFKEFVPKFVIAFFDALDGQLVELMLEKQAFC